MDMVADSGKATALIAACLIFHKLLKSIPRQLLVFHVITLVFFWENKAQFFLQPLRKCVPIHCRFLFHLYLSELGMWHTIDVLHHGSRQQLFLYSVPFDRKTLFYTLGTTKIMGNTKSHPFLCAITILHRPFYILGVLN